MGWCIKVLRQLKFKQLNNNKNKIMIIIGVGVGTKGGGGGGCNHYPIGH